MSIAETIKYIGRRRAADISTRKRLNIARPVLQGTPPRKKTLRRIQKQIRMGLSFEHKEVFIPLLRHSDHGLLRHPTKGTLYGIGLKAPHPDPEGEKINAPFFATIRQTLPREARKSKDQKRQCRVG